MSKEIEITVKNRKFEAEKYYKQNKNFTRGAAQQIWAGKRKLRKLYLCWYERKTTKSRKRGNSTMKLTEIKRTIREYHEKLYANKLDNWGNRQISNIQVWFHFFDVWLLKSFKPHPSIFPLCPTSDKADKKAQVLFHLPLMRWLS